MTKYWESFQIHEVIWRTTFHHNFSPSRCHLNQVSGFTDLTSCVAELKSHRLAIDRHDSFGEKGGGRGKTVVSPN